MIVSVPDQSHIVFFSIKINAVSHRYHSQASLLLHNSDKHL